MPKSGSIVSNPQALSPVPGSYEDAMAELEHLVKSMESGVLTLEASFAAYQRGAALVSYCQQLLVKIDQQIKVFEASSAGVEAGLKPLGTDDA